MNLDLSDDETAALRELLRCQAFGSTEPKRRNIDGDRFPLSPRMRPYRAILAKIDPPKPLSPLPLLKSPGEAEDAAPQERRH
jgi:hypothetical protein